MFLNFKNMEDDYEPKTSYERGFIDAMNGKYCLMFLSTTCDSWEIQLYDRGWTAGNLERIKQIEDALRNEAFSKASQL